MPKKVGRPTKNTPEVREVLRRCLRAGLSMERSARIAHIHPRTLEKWLTDDEFRRELTREQDIALLEHAELHVRQCRGSAKGDHRATEWFLARRGEEFRDKGVVDDGDDEPDARYL